MKHSFTEYDYRLKSYCDVMLPKVDYVLITSLFWYPKSDKCVVGRQNMYVRRNISAEVIMHNPESFGDK